MNQLTKRFLVTGFEPFNKHNINPSEKIIGLLSKESFNSIQINTVLLPVLPGRTQQTPPGNVQPPAGPGRE